MPTVFFEDSTDLLNEILQPWNTVAIVGGGPTSRGSGKTHLAEQIAYKAHTELKNRLLFSNVNHVRVTGMDIMDGERHLRTEWEMPDGLYYSPEFGDLLLQSAQLKKRTINYHRVIVPFLDEISLFLSQLETTTREGKLMDKVIEITRKLQMCFVGIANDIGKFPGSFQDFINITFYRDPDRLWEVKERYEIPDGLPVNEQTVCFVRGDLRGIGHIDQPIMVGICPWTKHRSQARKGDILYEHVTSSAFRIDPWLLEPQNSKEFFQSIGEQATGENLFEKLEAFLLPHYRIEWRDAEEETQEEATVINPRKELADRKREAFQLLMELHKPSKLHKSDKKQEPPYIEMRVLKGKEMLKKPETQRQHYGTRQWCRMDLKFFGKLLQVPTSTLSNWQTGQSGTEGEESEEKSGEDDESDEGEDEDKVEEWA